MNSEANPKDMDAPIPGGRPHLVVAPPSVGDRIAAFLEGTTNGEDLLHELYDFVLEEPLPQRMREVFDR
jgi:hypothetical protein